MFQNDRQDLPFFDELLNDYVHEINRQDAYMKRGGKLSAAQIIKYDNRVAMMVERLVVILEAIQNDPEAIHDFLEAVERSHEQGQLPHEVYSRFNEKMKQSKEPPPFSSERDRDRQRVVGNALRTSNLTDLSNEQILEMYRTGKLTRDALFTQLRSRQRAGIRLPKLEQELWNRYRSWLAEKRRSRR